MTCGILLFSLCGLAFAESERPPGRTLPDGTFQPKNLNALYEYPTPENYAGDNGHLTPEEALSIDWGPEVALSDPSFTFFYSLIGEGPEGFVHALTSQGYGGEPYYARGLDSGSTWEPGYLLWPLGGPSAGSTREVFATGDTVVFVFSSGGNAFCVPSTDRGASWEDRRSALSGGGTIAACRLGGDTLLLAHSEPDGRTAVVFSPDFGFSWGHNLPWNPQLSSVHGLGATAGALHMLNVSAGQEAYYSRLDRAGGPWSEPFPIEGNLAENSFLPKLVAWGDSNVLAFWTDYLHSPYSWTGDIFCRRSTDGGLSWLPVVEVTSNHLALNKRACPRGDSIFLVYDEYVADPGLEGEEIFLRISPDGGLTWEEPVRLTFAPNRSVYPSVAVFEDRVHVAWCDAREAIPPSNRNRLYYRRGTLRGPDAVYENSSPVPAGLSLAAYPNPFNSSTMITISNRGEAGIAIYDIMGRRVANLHAEYGRAVWNPAGLSSGVYLARVGEGAGASKTLKLIFMK